MKYMYTDMESLENVALHCTKCALSETRHHVVFGEGNIHARLMFIGEGPGYDEDRTGVPFVGKAGKLLDDVFHKVGISRQDVYIGNIVKCRPPNNRNPEPQEMEACLDYLRNQVMLIKPEVIVLLGSVALKCILGKEYFITKSRGQWIEKRGIRYMPTFHPAAVLRDESKLESFTSDLMLAKQYLDDTD